MKKMLIFLTVIILGTATLFSQTATPPSAGDGSEGSPYEIATLDNLYWLSQNSTEWYEKHFIQTSDIDASSTSSWDGGAGFSPIGTDQGVLFSGFYDGKDHTIDGLFINRPSAYEVAIFGRLVDDASIENLGVTNMDITGGDYVGGLVSNNSGTVSECYSTGTVTEGYYVGGLMGDNSGTVSECYSTGTVTGGYYVGGLMGDNSGTVSECYSTSSVTGDRNVGGLVGMNSGNIDNSYSAGSVTGGDYVGGLVGESFGYYSSSTVSNCNNTGTVTGGNYVGGLVGYSLECNINNSNNTGTVTSSSIAGGLVGRSEGTSIDNCYNAGTVTGDIEGDVGGLVGDSYQSSIDNCYNAGMVTGGGGLVGDSSEDSINNSYNTGVVIGIGGLVSSSRGSSIDNCYNTGTVTSSNIAGGLVGYSDTTPNYKGSIKNSYNTGTVTGNSNVGGLVGYNSDSINDSYSTGTVTGGSDVGGLVGYNDGGTITNSFWDTEASGQSNSDGGTGKTTAEMKDLATFTDETTEGLTTAWDFAKNPNDDVASDDIWDLDNSQGKIRAFAKPMNINDGYPFLGWQNGDDIALLAVSEKQLVIADEFTVLPAYPNPFNPSTTIRYGLENDSYVIVEIYDITGKLVSTLINTEQTQGWHSVTWNGTNQGGIQVPAGIYISKITFSDEIKTIKLMLLK